MTGTNKTSIKYTCTCCPTNTYKTQATGFYMSYSVLYQNNNNRLTVCKECVTKLYDEYLTKSQDIYESIYYMCRLFDIFYDAELIDAANKQAKKSNSSLINIYMQKANSLQQYEGKTFNDSVIAIKDAEKQNSKISEIDVTEDLIVYWGRGLENWEYEFLDKEIYRIKSDFECEDYSMEMIMKDIAFINLDIYRARMNDKNDVGKLIKTRSELMNDANLKPVQSTGADKNEKISFGVFIKKWENEKPVRTEMDDEMKRYIDVFMVGHLAKMEGLNNEAVRKYDEAIKEYTIDFKDLNKDEEDE